MKISEAVWAVVDCETTGLDPTKDRIVEVAYRNSLSRTWARLINPEIPIPCEASAIHHLTYGDIHEAEKWTHAMLTIQLDIGAKDILVAHNAAFDRSFMPKGLENLWICTERLARHLLPDAPRYTNQVLRYYLGGASLSLEGMAPHRAAADVIVTCFVFDRLVEKYLNEKREDTPEALIAFAESPILFKTIPFGKYRGQAIENVPLDYLVWCVRSMEDLNPDLKAQFNGILRGELTPMP